MVEAEEHSNLAEEPVNRLVGGLVVSEVVGEEPFIVFRTLFFCVSSKAR